jgi:hypothetical protein
MSNVEAISRNVQSFIYRDQGRWDELRDLFHDEASIHVSWYSGGVGDFIERSQKMQGAVAVRHLIGGSRVTISGDRAIADTDVTIVARTKIGGVEADLTSWLRFFDRFERRQDRVWRVLSRTGVYEKDRIDPVAPSVRFSFLYRLGRFDRFPKSCRHLAAGLVRNGHSLIDGIIEARSEAEAELWRGARDWLADLGGSVGGALGAAAGKNSRVERGS